MFKKYIFVICVVFSTQIFAQKQPNVIVVLADDIGVGDISYYRKMHSNNVVLKTPAIDNLAKNGMVFTDAHSPAALCAPSRYAVMTGNNCYRSYAPWGVWGAYEASPIKPNQLTLGKLMKNAGYQTAFLGKWGFGMDFFKKGSDRQIYRSPRKRVELGVDVRKIVGKGPLDNGFDYSLTFPAGIQNVPYVVYENQEWMPLEKNSEIGYISQENMTKKGVTLDKDEGLGDTNWDPHNMGPLLVNKAVDYIAKADTNKPFFMYYCSLAVHLPHTPTKRLNGEKIAGQTPSKHLDMVKELDVQMAMLVAALKKKGVYDNTIILFTSDNGGLLKGKSIQSGHKSNDIYRGGKNQAYEGGHRVPFIAWWPEKIKKNSTSKIPILTIDILATLAAITSQEIEEGQANDSANLLPIFTGENKSKEVHPYLVTQSGTGKEAIIIKDGWKLIIAFDKKDKTNSTRTPVALFNLNNNVIENEKQNLIHKPEFASKVKSLFTTYNTYRDPGEKTKI
ncbi:MULTISPECIES: sulfatase family protein [Cellulophaga]|uniref:Sulfatase n=2 Tax=Cellulophaga TaxID=104264 RepID=F0R9F1_CELLC|nr:MULTISPECIES: arylsulfatase [Cellulophaga]ADY28273.1 sulfatase [Cellulophaga lytica DSM 7489]AIM59342.1 sulfatase [Cellulophaga lytica]WQG77546.1 arylsulfatase [Cellulophaga lytica]